MTYFKGQDKYYVTEDGIEKETGVNIWQRPLAMPEIDNWFTMEIIFWTWVKRKESISVNLHEKKTHEGGVLDAKINSSSIKVTQKDTVL